MLYIAGFDRARLTLGTMTLSDGVNTDIVVDLDAIVGEKPDTINTTTLFWHYGNATTLFQTEDAHQDFALPDWSYVPWGETVVLEIIDQATTNGWTAPSTLLSRFDLTLARYFIGYETGGANISITWSTAAGRALFGFATNVSGSAGHTGTLVPTYVLQPNQPHVADPTPNTEAEGVGSAAFNAAGGGFSIARYRPILLRSWRQPWEPKALVRITEAAASHPETHEGMRHYLRSGGYPVIVHDGGFGVSDAEAFMLAPDGLADTKDWAARQRASHLSVPYRCVVMGMRVDA